MSAFSLITPEVETFSVPELAAGEVHVWFAPLDQTICEGADCLSADEWSRANRFHFAQDRQRYVGSRVVLRRLLSRYLDEDPAAMRLMRTNAGKPFIEGSFVRFNLSHSDNLVALAICHGREVGVDVEAVRDNVPFETLAEYYFGPEDQWTLRTAAPGERVSLFFEMWTRTEALLKGRGVGFCGEAASPADPAFTVRSLNAPLGYAAALAVEGHDFTLIRCQWSS